jgi:serine/threonine protein kinase
MDRSPLSTDALLSDLRKLGLLSREQAKPFAVCPEPRACAAQLVAAGALTAYQVEQVLAGQGRALHVGPYVLLERLGGGGMGHVYKAEHRWMKRVVALKIVGQVRRAGGDLAALTRFRREAEAAGRLCHPGIVAVHGAGESHGRLYLAMEHIEGVDLERYVRDGGPMPVDLACEVVRQTAEALYHTHERGLIHRDIKPSNLMLARPGVTVKLLDLGLAHFADSPLSVADAAEELCGTPDFMAPEWGRNDRRIDARSDLYSLGCTFYYLLTGRVPYPGGSWTEKLLRHGFETPSPVRELRPAVPVEVTAVVERLMAREREDRYLSAAAVVSALRRQEANGRRQPAGSGGHQPASAGRSPNAGRKKTPITRPRRMPKARRFSCGVVLAILLGVAAAGGARWIVTSPPAPTAPRVEPASAAPFTIDGRAAGFTSLKKAIAAARDGEVITIHGAGPFVTPSLTWQGKALTLRADGGARPRLELKAVDDPWQALLRTDRALSLEGIDLATAARAADAPLIYCEQASLRLTDCKLTSGAAATAIIARNPAEVVLHGCGVEAGAVGLSVEVGQKAECRIRMVDNRLAVRGESGAALSLWAPEIRGATAVRVAMEDNTIQAGRTAALRDLPAGLTIAARGNRFVYRHALLSYSGYADRAAWRGTVWQGDGNSREGPAEWLWVEGRPMTLTEKEPRP